jgi:D-alanine-D-alanine ligase
VNNTGRHDDSLTVLVIAGGRSSERDVSLSTGAAVCRGMSDAGMRVITFDPALPNPPLEWRPEIAGTRIEMIPPTPEELAGGAPVGVALTPGDLTRVDFKNIDLVFIALHGGDGENGRLQALLDSAGIAYTGSGMASSAMAMDKHASKRLFIAEQIPTPRWRVLDRGEGLTFETARAQLGTPLIVKPNAQGSTVGLTLVKESGQWRQAIEDAFRWDERLLVEEYIDGRELTVGVLGDEPLPVVEIIPEHGLYDYECKYTSGRSQYICPADLTADQTQAVQDFGLRAFRALGCNGYARSDFRLSSQGLFYCLEVNTLPGMTATSLVPKAARAAGIEFPELLARICRLAVESRARRRHAPHH